jgi:putative ABC transport system permease protein
MTSISSTLKIAFRSMVRRKFFTFVSLFGITFTLLVLVVAAAFVDHIVGTRPPESRSDRTLYLSHTRMAGEHATRTSAAGYGFLDKEVRSLPGAELVSLATSPDAAVSYLDGRKIKSRLKHVDAAFWSILDFRFLEGGAFTEDDDRQSRPLAVINEATRERFFGGAGAVGKTIELGSQRFRVVGVVEDVSLLRYTVSADVYVPIGTIPGEAWRGEAQGNFSAMILARSPDDFPALQAELRSRVKRYAIPKMFKTFDAPADTQFGIAAREILDDAYSDDKPGLSASGKLAIAMTVAALLFMSLPALNLINVNLSRVLERASEIGVRRAFGATRSRLVGQLVLENVALTVVGGVLASALASLVLAAINASGAIPYARLGVNLRVLFWGLIAALVFGVLSGVVPAWRMSRLHPVEALRGRAS